MLCTLLFFLFFFFNDTATTEIYTLSLHDALPISYAFEIAKNTAISYLRTLRRQIPIDQIEIELADSTFDSLFKENQEKRVSQAIKSLPKKYQKVIRLYYFSDLSYKDIGEELKLPVNTIMTHLRRAKESLKNTLKVYEER